MILNPFHIWFMKSNNQKKMDRRDQAVKLMHYYDGLAQQAQDRVDYLRSMSDLYAKRIVSIESDIGPTGAHSPEALSFRPFE